MGKKPTYEELEQQVKAIEREAVERKRAEDDLRIREERLRLAQDIARIGHWSWDIASGRVKWSDQVYKIFKAPPKVPSYKFTKSFVHPDDLNLWENTIQQAVEKQKPFALDYRTIRSDGKTIWVRNETQAVFDAGGQLTGYHGTVQDITEQKRTVERLHESETRLRTIFDASKAGIILVNSEGVITFANQCMADMFGCSLSELIGSGYPDHVHPDQQEAGNQKMRQLIAGEIDHVSIERHYIRLDGTDFWGFLSGRRHEDEIGNLISLVGIIADITELKASEKALRQSEEIHRIVTNNVWDSIVILQDAKVMWANNIALEKMGYSEDELFGLEFQKIIHPDDLPSATQRYQDRISGKPVEDPTYMKIITKDSRILEVENRGAVITWEGKPASVQTLRDITEEKKKEKEKKKLETQLLRAQKMEAIGTLAGGIAHDFNNILLPIMGYAEMSLDDVPKNSPLYDQIKEILLGTRRAADLVKQILAFSRQSDQKPKPLKVQLVIKEVLNLMRSFLSTTIKIKTDIDNKCGLVMADVTQIHQVAMNLITNAYHAMEDEKGILGVRLKEVELTEDDLTDPLMAPGTYVCLTVTDTGTGMDPSVISSIFEPYFTTKENGKGTGLGLAVAYGIVKSTGGDIKVYSEPGRGSIFHVYLPVIKSQMEADDRESIEPIRGGTERILLVDDADSIVRMEQKMLTRFGYQVTARTSSIEALEVFRAAPDKFDLLITDMTMPIMTGVQLSKKILKIRPDMPIIICTGFSTGIDDEKAAAFGIRGYVMKPVVMSELAKKIREILDQD